MSYIYLLREREFIKTNENIYKIGRSNQNNDQRVKQYPKGSKLIIQTICSDCKLSENEIISVFKEKYIHRNDIGNEYFEGDVFEMRRDINKIIDELDKLSADELQKRAEERIIYNKLKKNLEKQELLKKKQEEIEILNKKKEDVKKAKIEEIARIEQKTNELKKRKEEELNSLEIKIKNKKIEKEKIYDLIVDSIKTHINDIIVKLPSNLEIHKPIIQNEKLENKDYLQEFINSEIIVKNGHNIKRYIFRERFNIWCNKKGYPEDDSSDKSFSRVMSKKGIKNHSSCGVRVYKNIIFKNVF